MHATVQVRDARCPDNAGHQMLAPRHGGTCDWDAMHATHRPRKKRGVKDALPSWHRIRCRLELLTRHSDAMPWPWRAPRKLKRRVHWRDYSSFIFKSHGAFTQGAYRSGRANRSRLYVLVLCYVSSTPTPSGEAIDSMRTTSHDRSSAFLLCPVRQCFLFLKCPHKKHTFNKYVRILQQNLHMSRRVPGKYGAQFKTISGGLMSIVKI